jgi:hypothetical protein
MRRTVRWKWRWRPTIPIKMAPNYTDTDGAQHYGYRWRPTIPIHMVPNSTDTDGAQLYQYRWCPTIRIQMAPNYTDTDGANYTYSSWLHFAYMTSRVAGNCQSISTTVSCAFLINNWHVLLVFVGVSSWWINVIHYKSYMLYLYKQTYTYMNTYMHALLEWRHQTVS